MKVVGIVRSDNCTYSFTETLFVTEDVTSPQVWNRLIEMFDIKEQHFIELNCDMETEFFSSKLKEEIRLVIEEVEVVGFY